MGEIRIDVNPNEFCNIVTSYKVENKVQRRPSRATHNESDNLRANLYALASSSCILIHHLMISTITHFSGYTTFMVSKSDAINLHKVKAEFVLKEGIKEWSAEFSPDALLVAKAERQQVYF